MIGWLVFLLIAAVVAAALGFGGIAAAFAGIAQIIFYIVLAVFVVALIAHLMRRPAGRIR